MERRSAWALTASTTSNLSLPPTLPRPPAAAPPPSGRRHSELRLVAEAPFLSEPFQRFLPGRQRLDLPLLARLEVMLAFLQLRQHARFLALPLEAPEGVLQRFILANPHEGHSVTPPFQRCLDTSL